MLFRTSSEALRASDRLEDRARSSSAVEQELAHRAQYIAGGLQELGLGLLFAGWFIAAVIRVAQGSGTVAILTGAAIMAPLAGGLDANPLYLMMAIGFGGMIAPWYNDSGFWIISQVAGITQMETFETYSASSTIMSISGLSIVLVLSALVPL